MDHGGHGGQGKRFVVDTLKYLEVEFTTFGIRISWSSIRRAMPST